MPIKESNITVNVKELEKSILFYESIGLTTKKRWGNFYVQLTAPGITIGLHPSNSPHLQGHSGNVSIGFTVDDFEATKTLLQELSIQPTIREEEGGQFLHFTDPDGTALYFIKPKW